MAAAFGMASPSAVVEAAAPSKQTFSLGAGFRPPPGLPHPKELVLSEALLANFARMVSSDCFSEGSTADAIDAAGEWESIDNCSRWSQVSVDEVGDTSPAKLGYVPGSILQNAATLPSNFSLADTVPPPPVPKQLPSVGSACHHLGLCKPCDFNARFGDGCRAGTACKYCHLCGIEDLKRSKKAKQRAARVSKQNMWCSGFSGA